MQITEITVGWSETANLGNYSNVKPSLELKGTIAPGEDEVAETERMLRMCKAFVQEQVDLALEGEGHIAKYSTDPRFDILYSGYKTKIVVIVPTGMRVEGASCAMQKHRYDAALRWADEHYEIGTTRFNCSDGEIARAELAIAEAEAERERQAAIQRAENEAAYARQVAERERRATGPDPDFADDGDDNEDDNEDA